MNAQTLAAHLPDLSRFATPETASPEPSTETWDLTRLHSLPERLDDQTIASLQLVASSPLPKPEPCGRDHFDKCLRVMDAALPRRSLGEVSGDLMANVYRRALADQTADAMSHLTELAVRTCRWFPTIAECLDLLRTYSPPQHPFAAVISLARTKIANEADQRYSDVVKSLYRGDMTPDQIAALPSRWQGMVVEAGLVWRLRDGTYAIRPQDSDQRLALAAELIATGRL